MCLRIYCRSQEMIFSGEERETIVKVYVGNLPFSMGDEDLRGLFESHGTVASANVITDRETGRSRGFGFVEIMDDAEAKSAIEALNEFDAGGRTLVVNEARPKNRAGGRRRPGGGGVGRGHF